MSVSRLTKVTSGKFYSFVLLVVIAAIGNFIAYKIVHIPAQLEMVLIFSVCIFFPVIKYPQVGIYLLFVLMPFISFFRRLYYLQYSRPSADPLIIVGDIVIVLLICALFFEFKNQNNFQEKRSKVIRLVQIYFVYVIFRTFVLNSLPLTEAIMRFRFYGPATLVFFVGVLFSRDMKILKTIWIITLIIGVFASLYGFKQLVLGYSVYEKIWFSSISFTTLFIKGVARPFSFFQSPAAFADYMLISIFSLIVLFHWANRKTLHYLSLLLIPLFFSSTLITSVRSNWIGAIFTLTLWLLFTQFKSFRKKIGLVAGVIILSVVIQFLDMYGNSGLEADSVLSAITGTFSSKYTDLLVTQRVSALSNPFEEYSLLSRIALWRYIIALSVDPLMALLGRGVGVLNADSLYFTYLAEFGYPGIIFIAFLIICFCYKATVLLNQSKDTRVIALARGIAVMNIVFAVINITGTHIHSFPGDIYFWFWNGVLIGLISNQNVLAANGDYETACYT